MTVAERQDALATLLAKDEIRELVQLYSRGVDRQDMGLLRSLYTADATDDHAGHFSGSAADYVDMSRQRMRLIRAMDAQASAFDAWMLPTTAIVAPTIAEMTDSNTFNTKNMLLLRNTLTWYFFDMCAISIPIPGSGLPVGLMLVARNGHDRRLFEIAAGIERLFAA